MIVAQQVRVLYPQYSNIGLVMVFFDSKHSFFLELGSNYLFQSFQCVIAEDWHAA